MPPSLALLLCVCFIAWVLRADLKLRQSGSWALIVPGLWLAILASRPVPCWFAPQVEQARMSVDATAEGSPLNLLVQGTLMLASLLILRRRRLDWRTIVTDNTVLLILYGYFTISALWSPIPEASLKRIIKDFGCVLMALIILTEKEPFAAIRLIFVRCSYFLFPLSIVLFKYFPQLGRAETRGWETMCTGVTTHKNSLGLIVMIFSLMIIVDIVEMRRARNPAYSSRDLLIRLGLLLMGSWLLYQSDSITSWLCLLLGLSVLWAGKWMSRLGSPNRLLGASAAVLLLMFTLESVFGLSGTVLHAIGRNDTLTGRTDIWHAVLAQPINPVVGCGYQSFWESKFGQAANMAAGFLPNEGVSEAHNGYLGTFLDGGIVAVILLGLLLLTSFHRALKGVVAGDRTAVVMLMTILIASVYNMSEVSFFRLDSVWFACLLSVIKCQPTADEAWQALPFEARVYRDAGLVAESNLEAAPAE